MSDISDSVKYLYREFILRDLLSFVTPGAIVVVSALLLQWKPSDVINVFKLIPWIFYIPIFGILFMVGFAVQCFGEITKLIKIHRRETDIEHWKKLISFRSKADEKTERQHERFVVLKQMCGNGSVAILIASILFVVKLLIPFLYLWILTIKLWFPDIPLWILGIIVMFGICSLYWGHRTHLRRQEEWEDLCSTLSAWSKE